MRFLLPIRSVASYRYGSISGVFSQQKNSSGCPKQAVENGVGIRAFRPGAILTYATEDGDAREARDGTSVTQRSEVVKKTRIICGETNKRKDVEEVLCKGWFSTATTE